VLGAILLPKVHAKRPAFIAVLIHELTVVFNQKDGIRLMAYDCIEPSNLVLSLGGKVRQGLPDHFQFTFCVDARPREYARQTRDAQISFFDHPDIDFLSDGDSTHLSSPIALIYLERNAGVRFHQSSLDLAEWMVRMADTARRSDALTYLRITARRGPMPDMKRSYRRTLDTLITGMRSSRTRWWFVAALVTLGAASAHTLPVHAGSDPYHTYLEVVRSVSAFTLVGLCVASARASLRKRIGVGLIGASNGLYAIVVSSLTSAVTHGTVLQIYIGGLIAAAGAMFGAFLSIQLRRRY
jgi:hypothetical protein